MKGVEFWIHGQKHRSYPGVKTVLLGHCVGGDIGAENYLVYIIPASAGHLDFKVKNWLAPQIR